MPIKAVIDKLEDVAEPLRDLYQKVDAEDSAINGKFLLAVEPNEGFSLDTVENLKSALSAEREKSKSANSALEAFKGLDAREVRKLLAELEELKKIDPEKEADRLADAKAKTKIDQIQTKAAEDLETSEKRIKTLEARIEKAFKGDRITSALVEHGATKGGMKVLPSVINAMTRLREEGDDYVIEVLGDNGVPKIKDSHGTLLGLNEYVGTMKSDPDYAVLFEGDKSKTGGGTPPGQGANRPTGGKAMTRAEYEANPVAGAQRLQEGFQLSD